MAEHSESESETYLDRIVDKNALASFLEQRLGQVDNYEVHYHGEGHSNETLLIMGRD